MRFPSSLTKLHILPALWAPLILTHQLQAADPTAYVSTSTQDIIATYNPSTGQTAKLANAAPNAKWLLVSPDGTTAYVGIPVPYGTVGSGVEIVNLSSGKVSGELTSVIYVEAAALSSDGSILYVLAGSGVTAISTSTLSVIAETPFSGPCPCQILPAPDGSEVYASVNDAIGVFSAGSLAQIAILHLGLGDGMSISPDGTALYVLSPDQHVMLSVIGTATNSVVATVPNQAGEGGLTGTAVSPDGQTLYVVGGKGLIRVATSTNTVIDQVSGPALSSQAVASPDGKYLYVNRIDAEEQEDSVTATVPGLLRFDTASATFSNLNTGGPAIEEQIPVSGSPVYVLQGVYGITAEDVVSQTLMKPIPTTGTYTLAVSSSGNMVAGLTQISTSGIEQAAVSLVSTATHELVGQFTDPLPLASFPQYPYTYPIALNSGGTAAYIAYAGDSTQQGIPGSTISVLELPSGSIQQSFAVYPAYGSDAAFLAVSPDDSTLFVLFSSPGQDVGICSAILSSSSQGACSNLTVPGTTVDVASSMALSSDGTKLYVPVSASIGRGFASGLYLREIETGSLGLVNSLKIAGATSASSVTYSSSSNSVYMGIEGSKSTTEGALVRVDLGTFTVAVTEGLKYVPAGLAVTPDGTELLVTGSLNGTQIFDGKTLAPIGSIPGGQEQAIVIAPQ